MTQRLFVRRSQDEPYVMWRGRDAALAAGAPDLFEAANALADAIAEVADIVDTEDGMAWIADGRRVPLTSKTLNEVIRWHVAIKQLVESDDQWTIVFEPYQPDDKTLRTLLTAERREGGLRGRVVQVELHAMEKG
jgi:hypothetical protein